MLDLVLVAAGGAFLMGSVLLALLVDRAEARAAGRAATWAPTRPPPPGRSPRRLRLVRPDP
jgi:hypothetical protein